MPAGIPGAAGRGAIVTPKQPVFPLSVHSSGRYLVDASGRPFSIALDSGWSVPHNLSSSDQDTYLADRRAKGFNAVLTEAVEHKFTLSKPPKDLAGNLPFTVQKIGATYTGSPNGCTTTNGSASLTGGGFTADPYSLISSQCPDFTSPNSTYWAIIDTYISKCDALNMLVLLFPAYCGFGGADEGWMSEMVALDAVTAAGGQTGQPFADSSKSMLWNYGAWLANRYKSFSNILWVIGGDYGDGKSGGTFTTAQKTAVDNLMLGMKSVAGQKSTLFTAHWSRGSLSSDVTLTNAFDVIASYSGNTPAVEVRAALALGKPTFQIETRYELDTASGTASAPYRKYILAAACSGSPFVYGHATLWPINTDWATYLSATTAQDVGRIIPFFARLPFERYQASGVGTMGTIVSTNASTPSSVDYVASSCDLLGRSLVCYVPPAWTLGTFTVDLSKLSAGGANALCRWWDPSTGSYTTDGTYATSGTHVFTPPASAHADGFTDWILLCEAQ